MKGNHIKNVLVSRSKQLKLLRGVSLWQYIVIKTCILKVLFDKVFEKMFSCTYGAKILAMTSYVLEDLKTLQNFTSHVDRKQ